MTTLRTPIHKAAEASGATFGQWRQWELPLSYGDVKAEYISAKDGVVLHDASYLGRVKATGADVLDLLNRLSTNRVDHLGPGEGAPTILTSERGRIIDLVYILNLGPYVLLLTSPGAEETVMQWLDKYTIMEDSTLEDLTHRTTIITLAGPKAQGTLETLTETSLGDLGPFRSLPASPGGLEATVIRMDIGARPGFHLMVSAEDAEAIWKMITDLGATPVGMEAWEALRVEAGIPAYGKEMGEAYNPLEVGLIGSIDFDKGCYIGQEVIARLDTYDKVQRTLVSLKLPGDPLPQEGDKLTYEGKEVGSITSLARVPTDGRLVGLGYVRAHAAVVGIRLGLAGGDDGSTEVSGLPRLFDPR